MIFGKKKKNGPIDIRFHENQFYSVISEKSENVTHKYCINAEGDKYTLLYRDGKFMGMPAPFGGSIYPFATDPTQQGTNRQKKQFHSMKIVCLSNDFNFQVFWGTSSPFILEDKHTRKAYSVGANGVFYVHIDPSDAAHNANTFYSRCLSQRDPATFDIEALCEFLRAAFVMRIGAKIQEYIETKNRSLANYVGLMPSEILAISEELCPTMKDIFSEYGLSIVVKSSSGSILQGLMVNELVKN